jgi:hypothetical protein
MTVKELIAALQNCDSEARVVFGCDYGDRCHTEQALQVEDCSEMDYGRETIEDSGYSESGLAIKKADEDDREQEEIDETEEDRSDCKVVILR